MQKTVVAGVVASCLVASGASAQIAISSNDHKMKQENGVTGTVHYPPPDTITILNLGVQPVKVVATISGVPGSVVGPPTSVAITPDESIALVASSTQIDPADRSKTVPDDTVTIIDLKENKAIGHVSTGKGAAGVSITRDGKRAYVANRMAGSVSLLSIDGKKVALVKTEQLVPAAALLSHVALTPNGAAGVATRNGDAKVDLLKLDGNAITVTGTLDVAPRPYAAAITPDGKVAVIASLGDPKGNGVLTLIDMAGGKIIDKVDVGYEALEGMMMSADGKWVAGVLHAGSTRPKDAPQYKPNGMLVLYRLDGNKLAKTSEAPIGGWAQGAAFSTDGTTLVVQNMHQQNMQVFRVSADGKLTDTGQLIGVNGGPAAIRASTSP